MSITTDGGARATAYDVLRVTYSNGTTRLAQVSEAEVLANRDIPFVRTQVVLGVGDKVAVRAFGNIRSGEVTSLGRKRVVVRFVRNASGVVEERAFPITDLYAHGSESLQTNPFRA